MVDARGVAAARGIDGNPYVEAAAVEGSETRLYDADDGSHHAFDGESLAEHLGIAVELALPELAADDDCLRVILRFGGKEDSPQNRFRAQQAEQIRSYIFHAQRPRLAESGNAGGIVETDQCDVFKDVILLLPVDQFRDGGRGRTIRVGRFCLPNDD